MVKMKVHNNKIERLKSIVENPKLLITDPVTQIDNQEFRILP